uniref:FZ domain-containing protein n=1 Tax=Caenorhabditis japonica TaxID=281687 RepID=A0A8R1EFH2_CAEJA
MEEKQEAFFPNLVGEESFKDASESISTYKPLLSVVCSEQLKFFLCSVYFPMCNEKLAHPIGPCRPLCLSVKEKCLPVLESFGFAWPEVIRCDKFPLENNREKMCMKGPNEQGAIQDERAKYAAAEIEDDGEEDKRREADRLNGKCPTDEVFLNRSAKCVPLCSNPQKIGQADRDASSKYLLFLALSSVILTILSVFVVSLSRLEVLSSLPETAMFFSSLAFCVTSAIYILSVAFKDQFQISCTDYTHHLLFVVDGLSHVPCSSVASLIYYSATCSRLWWLLLCFSWNKATRTAHILTDFLLKIKFDDVFHGTIQSRAGSPKCIYANGTLQPQIQYFLKIPLTGCSTKENGEGNLENEIEVIMDKEFNGETDKRFLLTCIPAAPVLKESQVTVSFGGITINSDATTSSSIMDNQTVDYRVRVLDGNDLNAKQLQRPLAVGDRVTYTVEMSKDQNGRIGRCWANDGISELPLSDSQGCSLQNSGELPLGPFALISKLVSKTSMSNDNL